MSSVAFLKEARAPPPCSRHAVHELNEKSGYGRDHSTHGQYLPADRMHGQYLPADGEARTGSNGDGFEVLSSGAWKVGVRPQDQNSF